MNIIDWGIFRIHVGDCREAMRVMAAESVHCCVTSPPYFGLRDYGVPPTDWPAIEYATLGGVVSVPAMTCCLGLESTPDAFVGHLVQVFREVRRVLRDDGTLWLNLGDSYNAHPGQRKTTDKAGEKQQSVRGAQAAPSRSVDGLKPKDLIGIPWRVAFALQADGWYLRQDVIWSKPNPMPESVRDRCTKAHEYVFLLAKGPRYYWDAEAMQEPATTSERDIRRARVTGRGGQSSSANYLGSPQRDKSGGFPQADPDNPIRNRRSVWTVATRPYRGAHFATFPPDLIEPCIRASSRPRDTVLDPFGGSGTTGMVACLNGRRAVLCEASPTYATDLAAPRISRAVFGDLV